MPSAAENMYYLRCIDMESYILYILTATLTVAFALSLHGLFKSNPTNIICIKMNMYYLLI